MDHKPTSDERWPTKARLEPRTHQHGNRSEENVDINKYVSHVDLSCLGLQVEMNLEA